MTKLTWDNAALMSPNTAKALGIDYVRGSSSAFGSSGGEHGHAIVDMVELTYRGGKLRVPVWIQPGHADDAVTVHLGHGRSRAGHVGNGVGFNAYALRTTETLPGLAPAWKCARYRVRSTSSPARRCTTTWTSAGPSARLRLGHFHEHPRFAQDLEIAETKEKKVFELVPGPKEKGHDHEHKQEEHDDRLVPLTLYPETREEFPYNGARWAMAIDLTTCTGCTACVVACQSENNIPVVGKEEVTRGREMHWLRIDRYFTGDDPFDANQVSAHFQPVPCMQCEKAPCELVCPVGATVHSHDGLNDMVYNRCVGTRYCSNNCPYKVRRFNFLHFADYTTGSLKLMRNPEVTVRSRGVMEKCTYCVQRIRVAEIEAEKAGRPVRDGEVMTACQAVCPAGAILFGDLNQDSDVKRWKEEPLNYALLAELNTQPRTTYLAALRNPNPELEKKT